MVLLDEVAQLGAHQVVFVVELEIISPFKVFWLLSNFLCLFLVVLYFLSLFPELIEHLSNFGLGLHQFVDVLLSGFNVILREIVLELLVHLLRLGNVLFERALVLLCLQGQFVFLPLYSWLVK